jgi:DNA-damage-inducible protein J
MNKTAVVRARIQPELKDDVEAILSPLGLTLSEAIGLFLHQIKLRQGLPFVLTLPQPNAVTRRTFENTDAGQDVNTYPDLDTLFTALDEAANAPD